MKINKNSWHYKYVASMWDNRPQTLCVYFWKVVFTIVGFYIAGSIAALGAAAGILYFLFLPIFGWFINPFSGAVLIGMLLWATAGITALIQYRLYLYRSGKLKRVYKTYIPKEPGLVRQYINAKHRKICPLLEYERY